jgi:hypothetical protein
MQVLDRTDVVGALTERSSHSPPFGLISGGFNLLFSPANPFGLD